MKVCRLCRHYAAGAMDACPRDGGELVEGPLPPVAPGEHVGPYVVGRAIAAGQSGVLLEVKDEADDDATSGGLLLKLLNPVADPVDARRPVLEAMVGIAVPGVQPLLEVREEKGRICLVQTALPGTSLAVRLKREGPLNRDETLALGQRLCAILKEVYGLDLHHHDLRPGHLIVPDSGNVRDAVLIDLGSPSPPGPMAAPELHQGLGGTEATDVYGLCVTLYAALAGRSPFRADSPQELAWMVRDAPPPPLKVVRPKDPADPSLERLIMWGLSKDPRDRPGLARVAAVLDALAAGDTEKATLELEDAPATALPPRPAPPPDAAAVDEAPPELSAVAAALAEQGRDDDNPTMRIVRKILPRSLLGSTGLTQSFFVKGEEMEREVVRAEQEESRARRENLTAWIRLVTLLAFAVFIGGVTVWALTR
jgi:serine/threonine protein kinase